MERNKIFSKHEEQEEYTALYIDKLWLTLLLKTDTDDSYYCRLEQLFEIDDAGTKLNF